MNRILSLDHPMKTINLKRTNISLFPDCKRVLLLPFHFMSGQRADEICAQIIQPKRECLRLDSFLPSCPVWPCTWRAQIGRAKP